MQNKFTKYIVRPALVVLALLLIPFVFRWPWDAGDFIIGGGLIFITGLAYELVTKNVSSTKKKIALGAVIFLIFALIWAELAVGLFGTPFAGN